jgi:hypothetical protein
MLHKWPQINADRNRQGFIDLDGHRRSKNDRFFFDANSDGISEELQILTTDSVDASKIEHVVEKLKKRNMQLM